MIPSKIKIELESQRSFKIVTLHKITSNHLKV